MSSRETAGQHRDHPQSGRGGQQAERGRSSALSSFRAAIAQNRFIDDPVMVQSEPLAKVLLGGRTGAEQENSRTQVRKFYNQVRVIQRQSKGPTVAFETLKPKMRVLQAQAAYAVARKILAPDFKEFFDLAINKIIQDGEGALDDFVQFFESLYAYFYFHSKVS